MPWPRTRSHVSHPRRIALVALVLAISAGAALAGSSRSVREPERIFVTAVSGSVSVTMAGSSTPVQLDSTVDLPARIVTGDDGMLSLTQAGTNITIAADSDVEIPAEASDGQLIARLVQRRGNVFYDVAHREVGTLRVETPFLVAVIKGTQFNVAVQEDGSTISLFQGRLEIRTPDGSDSVLLNAGQIASRTNAGEAIRVIGMNDVRLDAPRTGVARNGRAASEDALQPRVFVSAARLESASVATDVGRPGPGVGPDVDVPSVALSLQIRTGSPGVSVGAGAGLGAGGMPAMVGGSLNVGPGSSGVSLGAGAGLGAGGAPSSVGASLNVGTGSPGVSLGAGAGVGAGVSLGPTNLGGTVTVDTGLGNNGLHLGTGGGIGDNPGLHVGNGNGKPAPPGQSHGHP